MKREYPFYAVVRGVGTADVYHTHSACQIAQSIELEYRVTGIPATWSECVFCATHWAAGLSHQPVRPTTHSSSSAFGLVVSHRARLAQVRQAARAQQVLVKYPAPTARCQPFVPDFL